LQVGCLALGKPRLIALQREPDLGDRCKTKLWRDCLVDKDATGA